MSHARRSRQANQQSLRSREPRAAASAGLSVPAGGSTTDQATDTVGSTTPVLDRVKQQQAGGGAPPSKASTRARLSATEATRERLAKELHNGRTGEVSAWFSVGVEKRLGKLAAIGVDFGMKLSVEFHNDRRVRATLGTSLTFKGEVDLLLFKAGLRFTVGGSTSGVWNSPDHFYAYLQELISGVEAAAEQYVGKKAGADGAGQTITGTRTPASKLDGTPTMAVSTTKVGVSLAVEKGKLIERMPWLQGLADAEYERFTATRSKDGKRQELHGWLVRGKVGVDSAIGRGEVEYSYTENHPNPDQNGVFWDLRIQLGRGRSGAIKPHEVELLKAQMKGFAAGAAKGPKAKAKAWLDAAAKALAKLRKAGPAPRPTGKVQPDMSLDVHVQWNGASDGSCLRFVHVHRGVQVKAHGELPLGLLTLTGEVGVRSQTEILEVIGTNTLLYTKNVYNGFKRRADHPVGWNAWVARHKDSLWALLGQVNVAGSQPSKEAGKRLKAAASQASGALAAAKVDDGVLTTLLGAATRDFEEEGNEASWKTVVDPKERVSAKARVSGVAGRDAAYGSVKLRGRLLKKPKRLRDIHDQGVPIEVDIPQLTSQARGGFSFTGKQPSFADDFVTGLKGHFPSRGRDGIGLDMGGLEMMIQGQPVPTQASELDGMRPMSDRLLDGVIESVLQPSDPTAKAS